MLSRQIEEIGRDFFLRRLRAAEAHRRTVVHDSDAYRVVHGEADLLPALVVDRYGDYLVMQTLDQGMDAAKAEIASCLDEIFQPKGIVARNDVAVRAKEELPLETAILCRRNPRVGHRPHERPHPPRRPAPRPEDRHLPRPAPELPRRRPLRPRRHAPSIASPPPAASPSTSRPNARASKPSIPPAPRSIPPAPTPPPTASPTSNGTRPTSSTSSPATPTPAASSPLVVLDPPAFAKNRRSLDPAISAYKEINLRALRLLQPGGILVTCSCSHHLSEAALLELVAEAALDANRTLRVLERRTQSQDHPILLTVPETLYLKCLILEVV